MSYLLKNKTIDVPSCAICMEDLTEELNVTSCGHVYHAICIIEGLIRSSKCPMCRKNITNKDLRPLTYRLQVTEVQDENRIQFLESLKKADQEKYLELIVKNEEIYKELKIENEKVKNLTEKVDNQANLLTNQGEMISALNREKHGWHSERSEWKAEKKCFEVRLDAEMLENEKLAREKNRLDKDLRSREKDLSDYERLKTIIDSATDNEDEYLRSIRKRYTDAEQAKTFYEFLRVKKGELKKAREELRRVSERLQALEHANKKKPEMNRLPERFIDNRREMILPKKTLPREEKMVVENLVKAKEILPSQPEAKNIDFLSKENDEMGFSDLSNDLLNSCIKDSKEKDNIERKSLSKQSVEPVRSFKSLAHLKGFAPMNRTVKPSSSAMSQQTGNLAFANSRSNTSESLKRKVFEPIAVKKFRFSSQDLGLKPTLQQKLAFSGNK